MSDIKVLAWGVMTKQGLVDVSTDREDTVEAQRYAKTCPIIELVDKADLSQQSKRIQELEQSKLVLESAIGEFLKSNEKFHQANFNGHDSAVFYNQEITIQTLRNLMENKND